jgi:hypothetical protein
MMGRNIMADPISTPLIAAGATIVGAAIPVVAAWIKERGGPFIRVATARQRSVVGDWKGSGSDQFVENGKPPIDIEATFTITLSGRRISADAMVSVPPPLNLQNKLKMTGGFCNEDLIQLTYRSADSARVQYGVILFKLSDSADKLYGHYAGFSPTRGCLIVGQFQLFRVKS